MKIKKIVLLGGGTGTSTILRGLKYFPVEITSVITVADNGRSTGKLRKEFSAPGMGDIRQALSSLSPLPAEIKNIMEYRMSTYSDLNGHRIGNLILTAFYQKTGSFKESIKNYSTLLDVKHPVLPLSEDYQITLMGETEDGEIIEGEDQITHANKKYKRIFYKNEPKVTEEVFTAINEADLILLSMGSLYTSLIPHLVCKDVVEAIKKAKNKAKVMYVCNAMTQPGETDDFGVSDHVKTLERYLGKDMIDCVIVSNTKLSKEILNKYSREEDKELVEIDYENMKEGKYEVLEDDLLTTEDGTIKHDSLKLSSIIFSYLMRK